MFSQKNLTIRAEKTFFGKNTISKALYKKFATISDFEKKVQYFLEKKPIYYF